MNDKGVAEIRQVLLGDYQSGKDVVVLGGLRDGDQLIVDGAMKVVPGQPVKIVPAGASTDKPAADKPPAEKK